MQLVIHMLMSWPWDELHGRHHESCRLWLSIVLLSVTTVVEQIDVPVLKQSLCQSSDPYNRTSDHMLCGGSKSLSVGSIWVSRRFCTFHRKSLWYPNHRSDIQFIDARRCCLLHILYTPYYMEGDSFFIFVSYVGRQRQSSALRRTWRVGCSRLTELGKPNWATAVCIHPG